LPQIEGYFALKPKRMRVESKGDGNFFDDLASDYRAGRLIWREVSHDDYWYALGAVPPVAFDGADFLMGEAQDYTESDVVFAAFVDVPLPTGEAHWSHYYARHVERGKFKAAAAELRDYIFQQPRK